MYLCERLPFEYMQIRVYWNQYTDTRTRTHISVNEALCLASTIRLPFCRCHFVVPLPFFRSVATVAVAGENGNAGNIFPYTYSDQNVGWPKTAERQK